MSDKKWIQKAINPEHKGFCTPITKKTCTPHRKALAMRFKHWDIRKKEKGGKIEEDKPIKKLAKRRGLDLNVVMDNKGYKFDDFRTKILNATKKGGV